MERLTAAGKAMGGATANQVLFSTLGAVLDFADACPPEDDLTLLVVRRREALVTKYASAGNRQISRPRRVRVPMRDRGKWRAKRKQGQIVKQI